MSPRSKIKYYDLSKNWRKVRPHLDNPRVASTLVRDFNKFTYGRWRQRFTAGRYPREFESCDWDIGHRGRRPQFGNYVKHSACHWLVNFSLELAQPVEPDRKWRIITSDQHSTVWDGGDRLVAFYTSHRHEHRCLSRRRLGSRLGSRHLVARDHDLAFCTLMGGEVLCA